MDSVCMHMGEERERHTFKPLCHYNSTLLF